MRFYYVATGVNSQGIRYVSSDKFHKNAECPSLSGVDIVVRITNLQNDGFEPCGQCYDRDD